MSLKFFTKRYTRVLLALLMTSAAAFGQSGRATSTVPTPPARPQEAPAVAKPKTKLVPPAQPVGMAGSATPAQPQQVITIVHRLSGWKLRTWLAFTNARVLEPSLVNQFVYTNIVAGYVLGDGRSVVARLPEADAEIFNLPAEFGFNDGRSVKDSSGLTLVGRDGARLSAKFIGVDGSTWLTLIESDGLRLPPSREASDESLAVGQPVRLFAPLRAAKTRDVLGDDSASVYMRVEELRGTITEVARTSTGSVTRLTVRADGLSPQVVGGVVLNEAGETVGLVETSKAGEARVMPASIVKRAAARVRERRTSVPRPLLGVRGEAIASTTLNQLSTTGWKMEEAYGLLKKQQGVLLTMVAPNSPAALADLRAGDIIVGFNNREVKDSEDFSFLLNEAGGGASVQFTYLRADEKSPRDVTIKLSEAFNLNWATEKFAGFQSNANLYAATVNAATAKVRVDLERLRAEAARLEQMTPLAVVPAQPPTIVADLDWLIVPTPADKSRPRAGVPSALLVNVVRSGSPADKLGLRPGDVIVNVNGKTLMENEWPEKFLLRRASELSLVVMRGPNRVTLTYEK